MARLPRSPIAVDVQNNYRPVREARANGADPVGQALEGAGNAGFEIASRMADAKIAADAAEASIKLRSRLDAEYRAIENDMEGDPAGFEARFRERAAAVANEEAGRLSSPAMRRAFGMKSQELTETFTLNMRDVTRRRQVEGVKAQTMRIGADYEALAADPDKHGDGGVLLKEAQDDYLALIGRQQKAGIYNPEQAEAARIAAAEIYRGGVSTRVVTRIDRFLDAGDYVSAEQEFLTQYNDIAPGQRDNVKDVLETKKREGTAIATADRLWSESGRSYEAFIAETSRIENVDERLAVEARGAQLKGQMDAGREATDRALLEEGMGHIVNGKGLPADLLRRASPLVIDRLQSEQRTRQLWNQQMATASAQEKAALRELSKGNYYRLKAQLNDRELAAAGFSAILADPQLNEMYENMTSDEQGQFYNDAVSAANNGGVPADKTLKAYKDVMALVGTSLPEGMTAKTFGKTFKGAGEGDPGAERVSANRKKSKTAIELEGVMMRLVGEELERTGGAPIDQDRAKQLAALALAEAGTDPKTGQTKYPVPVDIARGVISTDARTQVVNFRRDNPAIWTKATQLVRSQYPDASDALVLEEARKLQAGIMAKQAMDTVGGFFSKPEGE